LEARSITVLPATVFTPVAAMAGVVERATTAALAQINPRLVISAILPYPLTFNKSIIILLFCRDQREKVPYFYLGCLWVAGDSPAT
jgi:hypothetical protein